MELGSKSHKKRIAKILHPIIKALGKETETEGCLGGKQSPWTVEPMPLSVFEMI